MNSTQKIIVLLLILAIVFSAVSIFISFSALNLNIDLPRRGVAGQVSSSGASGISLFIEEPPERGDG